MSAKRREAEEQIKLAEKHLTKTMFRWQPDYMLAAPCLEKAADAYRSAKEYDLAKRTFLRAANVQEKNKSSFRAAQNTENAAKVIIQMLIENPSINVESNRHVMEVKDCYEAVSNHFVEMGELGKAADALVKGASFCEERKVSSEIIKTMYLNACSLLETQGKPHFAIETFRKTIGYLVRIEDLSEATKLLQRQVTLFQAIDQTANVYKCYLSYVILQLARGDIAAADTYYQTQLQDDTFLHSDECAVTDDLVRAFQLGNGELLETTLKNQTIHFIDHQIGKLARTLKLYGSTMNSSAVANVKPNVVAHQSAHDDSDKSRVSRNIETPAAEFNYDALELGDGLAVPEKSSSNHRVDAVAAPSANEMVAEAFDLT